MFAKSKKKEYLCIVRLKSGWMGAFESLHFSCFKDY